MEIVYNNQVVTDKDFCLMPLPVLTVLPLRCGVKHFGINMETIECSRCKKKLSVDNFHKNRRRKNGYHNYCKKCKHEDNLGNIDNIRRSAREWRKRNKNKIHEKVRKDRAIDPEKPRAREKTRYYIANGVLVKQPCIICGDLKVQAHHEDYSKPLDVMWLCKKHHAKRHVEINAALAQTRKDEA